MSRSRLYVYVSIIVLFIMAFSFTGCDMVMGFFEGFDDKNDDTEKVVKDDEKKPAGPDMDGDGIPDSEDTDIDGDGLANEAERDTWRTNPRLADTDGDGWKDGFETDLGGNFSPLIANMPKMKLVLTTSPDIDLNYTESNGTSSSRSITKGQSATQETTSTSSYAKTASLAHGWSVETHASAGTEWSVGIALGYNGTYTAEDSWEWGHESTRSNTESVEASESYATENSIEYIDGTLSMGAKLINPSDIAYTVNSLTVTAYAMDPSTAGGYRALGTMTMDGGFSASTLQPKAETGEFSFTKTLSVGATKDLAANVPSVVFGLSGFSSTMTVNGETTDFTQAYTLSAALCAKVVIDYGDGSGKEPAEYLVATRNKFNEDYTSASDMYEAVSLAELLSYIGLERGTQYTVAAGDGHINSLSGIQEDAVSKWIIALQKSGVSSVDYYSSGTAYDLSNIIVGPGDRVDIFFSRDSDGDGLVLAMENIYGSDDNDTDTDDDGISDFNEVTGWDHDEDSATPVVHTHPGLADTDNDGSNDGDDPDPIGHFLHSTTEITSLTLTDYQDTVISLSESASVYSSGLLASESALVTITTAEPVASVTLNGASMTRVSDLVFTYEIASLRLGEADYPLVLTAEDGAAKSEKTLRIDSTLQDLDNLTLTQVGLSDTGKSHGSNLTVNWNGYSDSRALGALLLYRRGSPSSLQLDRSGILPNTIKEDGENQATSYASGETAVIRWDKQSSGESSLASSPFGASYYDQQYSFRVVAYGQNSDEPYYYYSPGLTNASYTTPYPASITVTNIQTEIEWTETSGAESSPDFIIDEDLESSGGDKIMDLVTKTVDNGWEPEDGESLTVNKEVDHDFSIPVDETARLFRISYDIDEDETWGEHDFVDSEREIQFEEEANDGLYSMNDDGKYSGSKIIDSETYYDNDKGELEMTWTVKYVTKATE